MASSTPSSELAGYGPPEDAAGAHALDGYGPPESIEDARADVGPEARHRQAAFGRPKMPEPKTDEELGIDEGPKFYRGVPRFLFADRKAGGVDTSGVSGNYVERAQDAPGTDAYASHHVGDEMNDTGAQALTGGALASPLASLAGAAAPAALSPMVSGAVSGAQQAAFQGQNPLIGATLGAVPGAPRALGAADRALGEAALARTQSPDFGKGPGLVARLAGKGAGMAVGGATHGPLGMLIGHDLGGRAANLFSKAGDAATSAMARRFEAQAANAAAPNMVSLPPSTPSDPIEAGMAASRKLGPNEFDAFDEPGSANQMVNHATVGGKTGVLPDKSFVESTVGRLKNGTKLADAVKAAEEEPDLRAAVIRDAKKFRAEASPDVEAQPEVDLAAQMQRSIDILEKLKAAKAAGNLTDQMVNDAVDAGVTPALIKKVTGKR
jgi:hypothetical protein